MASITDIAASIAKDTATVDEYLKSQDLPPLSFGSGPPGIRVPAAEFPDVAAAYERVITSTRDLHLLMLGPRGALRSFAVCFRRFLAAILTNKTYEQDRERCVRHTGY